MHNYIVTMMYVQEGDVYFAVEPIQAEDEYYAEQEAIEKLEGEVTMDYISKIECMEVA